MTPWAIVVAAIVRLSFSGTADGSLVKRWTPNVDFENSVNWDPAHVPSSVDTAVFQEDTAVPVVVPSIGIDVCQMILPVNGQLILEPNAFVAVSPTAKNAGGCPGQSVKFKRKTPMEWANPDNWSNEKITPATPHVERIPCEHDTAFFNPGNSFSVLVPDIPINIGAVKFGNQTFSQNELDEFLLTDVGDQELKSSSPDNDVSIVLTSTECNDKTGCECGTQVLLENVCEIVSEHCDTKLGCITPVKPYGHCCWICGASFLINYDPKVYNSETFNEVFEKDIAKMKLDFKKYQLFKHTSKITNGKIQVVLASGTEYTDAINEIAKTLHSLLSSYTNVGITNVEMFNSGLSYNVDGMTYGQMALTTCIIVISCMLAIIFYYTGDWRSLLSKSSSGQDVVFVKFENDTSDVELVNEDRRLQRKTSFDNPTYGAVENLSQSQGFSETITYANLSTSASVYDKMDLELIKTAEKTEE